MVNPAATKHMMRAYLFMTLIRIAFDYAPAEMNASTLPGAAIELRLSQPTQAARFPERISARVQGWQ
jgi:hypothetical protein